MSQIDVEVAKELFELLHQPMLAVEERIIQKRSPSLDSGALLELALQAAIVRLDHDVNGETFEHLRWKIVIARSSAGAVIEALPRARTDVALPRDHRSRAFRDGAGKTWTVTEGMLRIGSGAEQTCLFFTSDTAVRRVKSYPPNWRTLTDAELSTLSWSR